METSLSIYLPASFTCPSRGSHFRFWGWLNRPNCRLNKKDIWSVKRVPCTLDDCSRASINSRKSAPAQSISTLRDLTQTRRRLLRLGFAE